MKRNIKNIGFILKLIVNEIDGNWVGKQESLQEIINDYLLKDILVFQNIKKADKIYNLLRLLAFQIGNEISLNEL